MQIKQKILKYKLFIYMIVLFLITFLLGILIPYGGDDWGNYLFHGLPFNEVIETTKRFYLNYEGRFFSRLFNITLVPHQYLWATINAFLMVALYYMLVKILDIKNKDITLPLLMTCILFADMQTFAQVYVWKTGNITYFFPMVFAFFLIYIRRKLFTEEDLKIRWVDYLLIPLAFIFSMFVENVAIGIIIVCLLNLIYYFIKSKKIDIPMLFCLLSSILGFVLMMMSPGNINRLSIEGNFSELSLIEKIVSNIPNLINYTFIKNSFLIFLMIIIMFVIIKKLKNKHLKIIGLIYLIIPLITTSVNAISNFIQIGYPLNILLDSSKWYISLYWIIFAIIFIILVFRELKTNKKNKILYFLILAISSNGALMLSPVWGGRTACFTTFMLYMVVLIILFELNLKIIENKKMILFVNIILGIFVVFFTCYCLYIHKLSVDRNKYINYQIENDAKEYEVIILPSYWTWNLNTWGSTGDFALKFKYSYGMNDSYELKYIKRKDVKIDIDKLKSSSKLKGL